MRFIARKFSNIFSNVVMISLGNVHLFEFEPPSPKSTYDAKMKGDTHFGKTCGCPPKLCWGSRTTYPNFIRPPSCRHEEFELWVSPSKESGISEVPLRGLIGNDDQ